MRRAAVVVAVLVATCALATSAAAKVLRVGSYHGIKGRAVGPVVSEAWRRLRCWPGPPGCEARRPR